MPNEKSHKCKSDAGEPPRDRINEVKRCESTETWEYDKDPEASEKAYSEYACDHRRNRVSESANEARESLVQSAEEVGGKHYRHYRVCRLEDLGIIGVVPSYVKPYERLIEGEHKLTDNHSENGYLKEGIGK